MSYTYPVDMSATFQRGLHRLLGPGARLSSFRPAARILGLTTIELMRANVLKLTLLAADIGGPLLRPAAVSNSALARGSTWRRPAARGRVTINQPPL